MTFSPNNSIAPYLVNSIDFEKEIVRLSDQLTQVYSLVSTAVNVRDIAFYLEQEQLSGGQLFTPGNPQKNRYLYRKSYNFGALPNTAVQSLAHDIDFNNTELNFVQIYGTAIRPTIAAIPLPYVSADPIYLSLTATNITIETLSAAYIDYTAIITLVYTKG